MPLWKGAVGSGGGGGGGIATSFQLLAADPGAPSSGQVWYNVVDERFRGGLDGEVQDFAMATVINAALYPGADPADRINLAIADAVNGQTVDARKLSGVCGSTIIIDKAIKLQLPASLTFTTSPGIVCEKVTGSGSGDSLGPTIEGAGRGASRIFPDTGGVGIRIEGHDVTIRDLGVIFTSIDAANVGIEIQPGADPHVLRPNLDNLEIDGAGSRTSANGGSGITFDTTFPGVLMRCHIHGWLYGVLHKSTPPFFPNAIFTTLNRVYDNTEGIRYEKFGDAYVYNNTIEGNADYGVHILDGFTFISEMNHYEQNLDEFGTRTATNVRIEGLADAFTHIYTFKSDNWGTPTISTGFDVILGAGQNQYVTMEKCFWNCEISIGAGQPPVVLENSRQIGAARLTGSYVQMKSIFSGNATTWTGPTQNLFLGPWASIRINQTFSGTSGTVTYYSATNTIDPTGNSSSNYQAHTINTVIPDTNAFNLTNVVNSSIVDLDYQGEGVATNLRTLVARIRKSDGPLGVVTSGTAFYASVENTSAANWTSAASITVPAPINSGGGTIDDWYGLLINDPSAVVGITNRYAIYTFGGSIEFTLRNLFTFQLTNNLVTPILNIGPSTGVGIGIAGSANVMKLVSAAWTDPALTQIGSQVNTQFNITSGAKATASQGNVFTTFTQTTNTQNLTGVFYGVNNSLEHRGLGTISDARGIFSRYVSSGAGTTTLAAALRLAVSQSNALGTISTGWGMLVDAPTNTAGGTFTTYEGIRVTMPTSGTYTNVRGFHVTDPAGTTGSLTAILTDGGNLIFNEAGGAYSLRAELPGQVGAFLLDPTNVSVAFGRTSNTTSWFGITQPAATSGVKRALDLIAGAHTGLTSATEVRDVYLNLARTVSWATSPPATQRAVYFDAPTYDCSAAAQTITTAALLALSGPPVGSANVTITNPYTLWIESGISLFQGGLRAQYEVAPFTVGETIGTNKVRRLHTNEGAAARVDFTLPAAAAGLTYTFYVQDADGIRVTAGAGDTVRIDATPSGAAGFCESTTIGSAVTLVAINDTEWVAIAFVGTWTVT